MPWTITENHSDCPTSKPYAVVNEDSGAVEGCHETRENAVRQIGALEENVTESSASYRESLHKGQRAKGFAENLQVKDADQGLVTAVFSRFNVLDHDGDVTVPGAFPEGKEVPIGAYGHSSYMGELPVGKGVIRQTESEAILDGRFFLETTAGRDTFEVVKNLGSLQEWSYGFRVESISFREFDGQQDIPHLEKLNVEEVSPVLKGAGIDTVTIDAKQQTENLETRLEKVLGEINELKEGRALSSSNRNRLEQIGGQLRSAADDLDSMLQETAPSEQNSGDEFSMKAEALEAGINYAETLLAISGKE